MPEVEARRALSGRIAAFSVLAPVGSYAGKGTLRVLCVREPEPVEGCIELICGYESYESVN